MMNKDFEFYYKSYKHGNYVGIRLSDESKEEISKLIKKLKLKNPIDVDDLHVTLMYSENWGNPSFSPSDLDHEATAERFALFGPEKDCLVVKLNSESLSARHEQIKSFGFQHSYEEFKPHITLSYNFDGDKPSDDILEEIGELKLCDEYIQPIEASWSEK